MQNIRPKYFIIRRSELEGRIEPMYYSPEISELEKKIREKAKFKLRDYIVKIASGATPSVQESAKFYSDNENGIPFLRVQNLSPSGKLDLQDVKFINYDTHRNYLKRSQVAEGDLLVKITGVGRMAVASVAPSMFVGNTNQHMAVIKTRNTEVSQYLASYLNLDIVERLASRRSTGGTRPALDYSALKSIPIIDNIDFSILSKAEELRQQKELQAQGLKESIDRYLLSELGISLPEKDNSLKKRIFSIDFSKLVGSRLDPHYLSKYEFLINQRANFNFLNLGDLLVKSPQYGANEQAISPRSVEDVRYIRITDIDEFGFLKKNRWKTANTINLIYKLNYNDILFARSGSVGRCYIHKEVDSQAIFAGYLIRFVVDHTKVLPDFVFNYCNSSIYKFWVSAIERPAVQSNINSEEFKSLPIPLPDLNKQREIVARINEIRSQIASLRAEGKRIFDEAKSQIEQFIIEDRT